MPASERKPRYKRICDRKGVTEAPGTSRTDDLGE